MFGKRGNDDGSRFTPEFRPPVSAPAPKPAETATLARPTAPLPPPAAPAQVRRAVEAPPMAPESKRVQRERSEAYYDTKSQVFSALIDTIDRPGFARRISSPTGR